MTSDHSRYTMWKGNRLTGTRRTGNSGGRSGTGTPKAAPLLFVPESRFTEFGRGFGFGPEPKCHRSVRRRAIRSRTSVKARQQFGSDVGAFVGWKGQCFTE